MTFKAGDLVRTRKEKDLWPCAGPCYNEDVFAVLQANEIVMVLCDEQCMYPERTTTTENRKIMEVQVLSSRGVAWMQVNGCTLETW